MSALQALKAGRATPPPQLGTNRLRARVYDNIRNETFAEALLTGANVTTPWNFRNCRGLRFPLLTLRDLATSSGPTNNFRNPLVRFDDCEDILIEDLIVINVNRMGDGQHRQDVIFLNNVPGFRIRRAWVVDLHSPHIKPGKRVDEGHRLVYGQGNLEGFEMTDGTYRNCGRNLVQLARSTGSGLIARNATFGRGPRDSSYEDMINTYGHQATANAPLIQQHNFFQYGGPSLSGTGTIVGDGGNNRPTRHVHAIENIYRSTGAVGLNMGGGEHNKALGNIMFNDIDVNDPESVGVVCNDYRYAGTARDIEVRGNRSWWRNNLPYNGRVRGGEVNHAYINRNRIDGYTIEDNHWGDASLLDIDLNWTGPAGFTQPPPVPDTPIIIQPPTEPVPDNLRIIELETQGRSGEERFTLTLGEAEFADVQPGRLTFETNSIDRDPDISIMFTNDAPGRDLGFVSLSIDGRQVADRNTPGYFSDGTWPHGGERTASEDIEPLHRGWLHYNDGNLFFRDLVAAHLAQFPEPLESPPEPAPEPMPEPKPEPEDPLPPIVTPPVTNPPPVVDITPIDIDEAPQQPDIPMIFGLPKTQVRAIVAAFLILVLSALIAAVAIAALAVDQYLNTTDAGATPTTTIPTQGPSTIPATTDTVAPTTEAPTSTTTVVPDAGDRMSWGGQLNSATDWPIRNTDIDFRLDHASTPAEDINVDDMLEASNQRILIGASTPVKSLGQFRTKCSFSHLAYDDPIVFPGQPGAAHLHVFFGNTMTNAHSTSQTIHDTGSSTCNGYEGNRTGYWAPAAIDTNGAVRIPDFLTVYYKSHSNRAGNVLRLPDDLAFVSPTGTTLGNNPLLRWYCSDHGADAARNQNQYNTSETIPTCEDRHYLIAHIGFGNCIRDAATIDGTNINSSPLVAYPLGGFFWGNCPNGHVYATAIEYEVEWAPGQHQGSADWILSSDVNHAEGGQWPNGSTLHGDWMNGWNPDLFDQIHDTCVDQLADCRWDHVADNQRLIRVEHFGNRAPGAYTGPNVIPGEQVLAGLCPGQEFTGQHSVSACTS